MVGNNEEKIHILVVDDIPETRENLAKLLYFEEDIELVGAATTGEEGIRLAEELQPDIVLMDINMPGIDGISASEAISAKVPGVQVIMMSVQSETDYLRRSMLAGAREFLMKPFSSDELITSIRRVYALGASKRAAVTAPPAAEVAVRPPPPTPQAELEKGRIIAVFSAKGGTGCSTIATNLAIALHVETKQRVVLVDCSLQFGDVGVLLNLQANRTLADLGPEEQEIDSQMIDQLLVAHSSGIKAVLAPPRPEMAELVTPELIKRVLNVLQDKFDYIVVDTWSSFHDTVLTILDLSDLIVLLTTTEIPAIKNTKLFFEVTEALNYPPQKTVLVVNKADRAGGISKEDIEASIKYPVLAEIERDERTVTTAVNRGVPFVIAQRSNPISRSVYLLSQLLRHQLSPQPAEAAKKATESKGMLGRIFR